MIVENRGGAGGNIGIAAVAARRRRRIHAAGLLQRLRGQSEPLRPGGLRSVQGLRPGHGDRARRPTRSWCRRSPRSRPCPSCHRQGEGQPRQAQLDQPRRRHDAASRGRSAQAAHRHPACSTSRSPAPARRPRPCSAGQVDLYTANIGSLMGQIDGGKVRPIAVTSKERWPDLPDVPSLDELGIKDAVSDTFQGIYAPAGTPQPVDRPAGEGAQRDPGAPRRAGRSSSRPACRWWRRGRRRSARASPARCRCTRRSSTRPG